MWTWGSAVRFAGFPRGSRQTDKLTGHSHKQPVFSVHLSLVWVVYPAPDIHVHDCIVVFVPFKFLFPIFGVVATCVRRRRALLLSAMNLQNLNDLPCA